MMILIKNSSILKLFIRKNGYIEEQFRSKKYLAYPKRFLTYPRLGTAAIEFAYCLLNFKAISKCICDIN